MNIAEIDRPYGGLSQPRKVKLKGKAIEAVVAEVRFESKKSVDVASDVVEQLLRELSPFSVSKVEPAKQHQVTMRIGEGGAFEQENSTSSLGWQAMNPEKSLIFSLFPNAASVQVSDYERWSESMAPQIEALLAIVLRVIQPTFVQRIGLRYINRLEPQPGTSDSQWVNRIDSSFLGPLLHPQLGNLIQAAHQQLQLELAPGIGLIIRHGPLPAFAESTGGYLVDIDVFDETTFKFAKEEIAFRTQRMNRTALSFFQQMLTPEELDHMGAEELDSDIEGRIL